MSLSVILVKKFEKTLPLAYLGKAFMILSNFLVELADFLLSYFIEVNNATTFSVPYIPNEDATKEHFTDEEFSALVSALPGTLITRIDEVTSKPLKQLILPFLTYKDMEILQEIKQAQNPTVKKKNVSKKASKTSVSVVYGSTPEQTSVIQAIIRQKL